MPFLVAGPDITPIQDLISTWTHIAQALVASIGALAFIFGTIGVEVAGSLVDILTRSVPPTAH